MKGARQSSSSPLALFSGSTFGIWPSGCNTLLSLAVIVIILLSGSVIEAARLEKESARELVYMKDVHFSELRKQPVCPFMIRDQARLFDYILTT